MDAQAAAGAVKAELWPRCLLTNSIFGAYKKDDHSALPVLQPALLVIVAASPTSARWTSLHAHGNATVHAALIIKLITLPSPCRSSAVGSRDHMCN